METRESCTREKNIIRVASYNRRDFDFAVARINPHEHERTHDSVLQPARSPSSTLGCLENLSLELLPEICRLLDLKSLFKFRQISMRAQEIVCGIRIYRISMAYALEAVCAIIRTNIASCLIDEGYWTLNGPDVSYWEEKEGYEPEHTEKDKYTLYDEDNYGIFQEVELSEFLYDFNPVGAEETGKGADTKIMVNPHGRTTTADNAQNATEKPEAAGAIVVSLIDSQNSLVTVEITWHAPTAWDTTLHIMSG
ncbi:uncharacterized protein ASPGLDRAFT_24498 [Aspergillus glaucus CBS 516.65]|uniref:F-box domain-containing protein n=1 Tax=Aspergillus glaucus CBS 516.65 TaxID=1160497 RepID=A0A1L9VNG2_ASPGL|nr:hypothetical protein ASPGLDRAFT_24498 [Aspergillus glaucus CBS 516.65]OJJ85467.1 hypothetical protein ASPGLDRAFT_24498 [Aspergillus glaucus CBS 516.65]